ncbi:T9SS type A sorting domain-containing protein [Hymenobacter gummosus]|uniref:T9SS type A sorting domain-containing protein n=1 Tax=Hymenobacter gummosus TaxID=1776032 RepID=A0A3S0K342_9BACT|nr:T9SS type A sorting domain-containing protein [Hymenobacter gummosus]RTQ47225.1 T9SS type A sorting domain-containing protein [Hymenobacter gummosus]
MQKTLPNRLVRASRWLPLVALGLLSLNEAHAQGLNYTPATATNVTGTYTDLGTNGTAITTANNDDANSAATPIGFTFNYNGAAFTNFVLNTNGLIRLGTAAPSAANMFGAFESGQPVGSGVDPIGSTNPADVNLLAPFNFDLEAGTAAGGAEYRVATTGTAPNRVCTIQWKNVRDKASTSAAAQFDSFNFQLKLYETTNNIEFVYGPTVAATTGADGVRFPTVGIKGSGSSTGQTVLANKTSSAAAWSTTVFITGEYAASTHNYRRSAPADLGRTYRFAPAVLPANDIAVNAIYSLGQVSSTYIPAHVVQALVTNNSATTKTNVQVTLTVAGANTVNSPVTIPTLASGASTLVSFPAYPLTTSGVNTLNVSVPNDDVASNNTKTFTQNVSTSRLAYTEDNPATTFAGSISVSLSAPFGGSLAVRFNTLTPTVVNSIKPTFTGAGTAGSTYRIDLVTAGGTGNTPSGTVLYSSPTLTRPTVAATPITSDVSVPNVAVPAGDFFVVFRELTGPLGLAYQSEDPLRPSTFYFQTSATGAWTLVNTTTLRTRIAVELALGPNTAKREELGAGLLNVFPNPAVDGKFTVSLPAIANERTAQVSLLNNLGQQVLTRSVQLNAAGTNAEVNVSSLAKGLYTLRVQAGSQMATKQVVVE